MNFSQAQNWLFSVASLGEKNKSKTRSQKFENAKELLNLLGNPEKKTSRFIHITGTSGKGSVSLMLGSVLRARGKKTGVMVSPHASSVLERWQINGKNMSEAEFCDLIDAIKPKVEKFTKTNKVSFFEMATAIGFYYFAKKKIEWAVMEAGCGGRFDPTNSMPRKEAAVITNIGLDHERILGNSKSKIAFEKSGIILPGCRVFTAEKNSKILKIIKAECKKQKAVLKILNPKFKILNQSINGQTFRYRGRAYKLPRIGPHQIKNAILAIEIAQSLKIPDSAIKKGLANVKLPIRLEVVSTKPLIILDGAHNPDKIKAAVETIKKLGKTRPDIHLLIGFSANKKVKQMCELLALLKPKTVACARYTINPFRKSADPEEIAVFFKKLAPKEKIAFFPDPEKALNWSRKQMSSEGILLAIGSIFLSGELRTKLLPPLTG